MRSSVVGQVACSVSLRQRGQRGRLDSQRSAEGGDGSAAHRTLGWNAGREETHDVTLGTSSLYSLGEGRGKPAKKAAVGRPPDAGGLREKGKPGTVDDGVVGTGTRPIKSQSSNLPWSYVPVRYSSPDVPFLCPKFI